LETGALVEGSTTTAAGDIRVAAVRIARVRGWMCQGGPDGGGSDRRYQISVGRAIISQKIAATAAKAGKPKANHQRKSLW